MIKSFWENVIGKPPRFSLEARIFNTICIATIVVVFFNVFLNFLIGIQQLAIAMSAIFAIAVLCYYYSRFKMKLNSSIIIYMIVNNILLIVNYKYNSGIDGPTLLIFILSYFLTISIVPKKQYFFWITLNLVIVITLIAGEYEYPRMVANTYANNESRFIDFIYTYIVIIFFIFMVTNTVRKSYYTERKLVEEKATELELVNNTKNKLFSILAHDLRSPLASIQNYLEILRNLS